MTDILVRPKNLKTTANELRSSAVKILTALKAVDQIIRSLEPVKFEGARATQFRSRYRSLNEKLLNSPQVIQRFADDLVKAANIFEKYDKSDSNPIHVPIAGPAPFPTPPTDPRIKPVDQPLIQKDYLKIALGQKNYPKLIMNNKTGELFSEYGCLMTTIAMIARLFGAENIDPTDIDKWMDVRNGYKNGSNFPEALRKEYLNDVLGRNGSIIDINKGDLKENLEAGVPIILWIDYPASPNGGHYVLAIGLDENNNYICINSYNGEQMIVKNSIIRSAEGYKW